MTKNIGADFIDFLVAAEVPDRKAVVLTDIFDFLILLCYLGSFGGNSKLPEARGGVQLGPRMS